MLGIREAFLRHWPSQVSSYRCKRGLRIRGEKRLPLESGKKLGTTAATRNSIMVKRNESGREAAEVGGRWWWSKAIGDSQKRHFHYSIIFDKSICYFLYQSYNEKSCICIYNLYFKLEIKSYKVEWNKLRRMMKK